MEAKTIEDVLRYLVEELGGDWFLTGGSLVRLGFDASRGTEDIDLLRVAHPSLSDEAARNELYRWLMPRGLGPEWVNNAVEPFVRAVPGWESELVLFRQGSRGRVFRPTLTLFVYLKLGRGTEIDLRDIVVVAPGCPEGFDESKFMRWAAPAVRERWERSKDQLGLAR